MKRAIQYASLIGIAVTVVTVIAMAVHFWRIPARMDALENKVDDMDTRLARIEGVLSVIAPVQVDSVVVPVQNDAFASSLAP